RALGRERLEVRAEQADDPSQLERAQRSHTAGDEDRPAEAVKPASLSDGRADRVGSQHKGSEGRQLQIGREQPGAEQRQQHGVAKVESLVLQDGGEHYQKGNEETRPEDLGQESW